MTLTVAFSLGATLPWALGDDVPAAKTPTATGVVGDGVHDDTAGIQALLDTRRSLIYLPPPPKHYLISKPLQIHSRQTLQLDRFNVVSFTNHRVHPGSASTFEDISLRGLFCAKSGAGLKYDPAQPGWSGHSLVWIDAPAVVSGLTITDLHRTETRWPAASIFIEPGATVKSLQLTQAAVENRTPGPLDLLVNRGTIEHLSLSQVRFEATAGPARGAVVRNAGKIGRHDRQQVFAVNAAETVVEESRTP